MSVMGKILRFECLLCAVLIAFSATCLAQMPRRNRYFPPPTPTTSTVEQESQPNTTQYPGAPSNTGSFANPNTQQQQPVAPLVTPRTAQQNTIPNNVNPATPPTAGQSNRPSVAAADPPPGPPNPGFIGPPAPIPPTLEQMPPVPARIIYQNGLLSVESVNARLTDILNAIHAKAGIQFDGMQSSNDRVAGKFGPAPADEVLASLLQGSRYDYVIMGMPENPALVQRVILTPSSGAGAVAETPGGQPTGAPEQMSSGEEDDPSDEAEAPQNQVQSPPPPVPVQPRIQGATPKTTEQLLEELKQMQQLQQQKEQQNQQQNQQRPPAPIKPNIPH